MDRLDKEIAYAARYRQARSLLFIDLDKFKEVNDTFGHDAEINCWYWWPNACAANCGTRMSSRAWGATSSRFC